EGGPATPSRVARAPARGDESPPAAAASDKENDESAPTIPGPVITVTVETTTPIVDVQHATVSTNFAGAMLHDIPNQRDMFALLAQTPGITMPRPDVGGNTAGTQSTYRAYGLF